MAARKVQLKDNSGNKAYPVTSSACVGMSDGSGSLDEKIFGIISNSGYVTCTAAAGTAAKTVTQAGFALSTNCRLIVKMINYNTAASPTLNVNNTGAKPLYYNGEVASADNTWEAGEVLDVYYDGTNYRASNMKGSSGGNVIMTWNTDVATTRKGVKQNKRKAGLIISYNHPDNGWINEQYIGTSFTDSNWANDINWRRIADNDDITAIEEGHLESMRTIVNEIGQAKKEMTESISDVADTLSGEIQQVGAKYDTLSDAKQDKLVAGENIHIDPETNTISTDKVEVAQETGTSKTATMSQKAISDNLTSLDGKINAQKSEVDAAKEAAIEAINEEKQEAIADFSSQRVTPEMLSETTLQLINSSGGGTINNAADDEDLYSTGGEASVIKFKNKEYDVASFSGMGRVYLRKNIIETKNVFTQEMVSKTNTIYIIQYDYDLNGATIIFPENSVLMFVGGSFKNGKLRGNNTTIVAPISKIFGDNIEFVNDNSNSFHAEFVYAEWWGAESYTPSKSEHGTVYNMDAHAKAPVQALSDCAIAFNKAFEFASACLCPVKALGVTYAVRSTITIPTYTTFITEESTLFVSFIKGDGKKVTTQSEDDASFSTETLAERVNYLLPNQFIETESMGVVFDVTSAFVKFIGRGTIALNHTTCCIGILIRQRQYEALDMSYQMKLEVRFVSAIYGERGADSSYIYGHGAPTDETVNDTGKAINYIDLDYEYSDEDYIGYRFAYYTKANGSSTWTGPTGDVWKRLCTDIRIDLNTNDGRLISPEYWIGCMNGFRGVEIIVRNNSWFNISVWDGTISNKYGGFILIYTSRDVHSHNFSGVTMQWGGGNADTVAFYAIKASAITIGAVSDLGYSKFSSKYCFYFGKYTTGCVMTWIDNIAYVCDLGKDNLVAYNLGYDPQAVSGSMWFNVWENKLNKNLGFKKITTVPTEESLKEAMSTGEGFIVESQFPSLFDGDKSTYETFVDTDNGLYGVTFLFSRYLNWAAYTKEYSYLIIEYFIGGNKANSYVEGQLKYMVNSLGFGDGGTALTNYVRNIPTTYEWISSAKNFTKRIILPFKKGGISNGQITFFTDLDSLAEITLNIVNIKLLTAYYPRSNEFEDATLRNNFNIFYPKYSFATALDGSIFFNQGDENNNDWIGLDGTKVTNEIVITFGATTQYEHAARITIMSYFENTATYELIDPKGFVTAKMNNNVEGDSGTFPGGYNNGYRTVNLTLTGTAGNDWNYPYYYKLRLRNIAGIEYMTGYQIIDIVDLLRKDLKEMTSISYQTQGELIPVDDISNYVQNIKRLSLSLQRDVTQVEGTEKTKVSTMAFRKIEYLQLFNSIKMYGNIADLPDTLYHLRASKGMQLTYNTSPRGKTWNKKFSYLNLTNANQMTPEMIDALLIDFADSIEEPIEGDKVISLTKVAGNRTIASDAAVAVLEELGFTVTITT